MKVNLTFADQVLVSGCNFLTGVALARFMGLAEFGTYTENGLLLTYVNSMQVALIVAPMLSLLPQIDSWAERARRAGAVMAAQIALCAVSGLALAGISGILAALPGGGFQTAGLPLVLAVVFFQAQDWFRRLFFMEDRAGAAIAIDLVAYGGNLLLVYLLHRAGWLATPTAYLAMAGSFALACLAGRALCLAIRPDWVGAWAGFRQCWALGKDLVLAGQAQWAGSQGVLLLASGALGVQALGGIRAAMNVVGPIGIAFQAMENVVPIRASRAFATGGRPALKAYLLRFSLVGGLALALPCAAIAALGGPLLALAYGPAYSPFAGLVAYQALYLALGFYVRQLTYFHRTVGTGGAISSAAIGAALVSLAATGLLIGTLRESGALLGPVLGQVACIAILAAWALCSGRPASAWPATPGTARTGTAETAETKREVAGC